MNDDARQVLCDIIARHGDTVVHDVQRLEALLRDLAWQFPREVSVIVSAARAGIPDDLLVAQDGVPIAVVLGPLVRRLVANLWLSEEAALWAAETWAMALGLSIQTETRPASRPPQTNLPPEEAAAPSPPAVVPLDTSPLRTGGEAIRAESLDTDCTPPPTRGTPTKGKRRLDEQTQPPLWPTIPANLRFVRCQNQECGFQNVFATRRPKRCLVCNKPL